MSFWSVALISAQKQTHFSVVYCAYGAYLRVQMQKSLWDSWRPSLKKKCKFFHPDTRNNNAIFKLCLAARMYGAILCVCVSTVHSLMATLSAFPLNRTAVFSIGEQDGPDGHYVATSSFIINHLATHQRQQSRVNEQNYILFCSCWVQRQAIAFSGVIVDAEADKRAGPASAFLCMWSS